MEDKNELSDIVLEKEEGKGQRFKQILMGAAVLVLLFLGVLIVMRTLNKPESPQNDSRLVLPPEPTVTAPKEPETKEDQLFKQVPIIEEESKKESFEDMVKKLKEKEIKRSETTPPPTVPEPKEVKEVVKKEAQKIAEPVKKEVAPTTATVKEVFKEVAPTVTKTPVTPVAPVVAPTPSAAKGTVATKGVYVQVAATSRKSPDAKYLKTLESKSYDYRLHKMMIKEKQYIKILVGPFENSNAARAALPKIQKDLNPKAFIFRVP